MMTIVVVAHAVATLLMTGLIWFVQVVHYPLMCRVERSAFPTYEAAHMHRTTWIVAPLMLTEIVTAAIIVFISGPIPSWLAWSGAALVGVNWLSTSAVQVPCHRRLSTGFDEAIWRRLVRTNWVRTVAWSMRSAIAVLMLLAIESFAV